MSVLGKIKTGEDLAAAALEVVNNYKTLYVTGCFGWPMTESNKTRIKDAWAANRKEPRQTNITNASVDTFGFDCVNLIKALLWGWIGDVNQTYGGVKYQSNGVPDVDEGTMFSYCTDQSSDFNNIEIGEACWMQGHIGIYIGNGLSIECTPAWTNNVQITACNCNKTGYNRRNWTKHGKLPYVTYNSTGKNPVPAPVEKPYTYEEFIKEVQTILGVPVTSKGDAATLNATVTISASINSRHALVKPLQKYLYALGYTEVGEADGDAGPKFTKAVNAFQVKVCGVEQGDGEITAKETSWKKLINYVPVVEQEKQEIISTDLKVGDKVSLAQNATYTNGKAIANFVFKSILYVREIRSNGDIVISTLQTGAITGVVNFKFLTKITETSTQPKEENNKPTEVKKEETVITDWKINDEVKLIQGAKYVNNKTPLSWVYNSKLYIREFRENESAVVSTQKIGPITGVVYLKDLRPFNGVYDVTVTASLLNVRSAASTNGQIINQLKKDTKCTIYEESNGWGHIVNSGWISLNYTKKV